MAFVSLTTLKAALGIPASNTTRDTELAVYVAAANREIQQVFGLDAEAPTTYVETFELTEYQHRLHVMRWPVTSVTSVVEAATVSSSLYSWNERGLITALDAKGYWRVGRQAVTVTYVAGFTDPTADRWADLRMAALMIAIYAANTTPMAGVKREKIGQYEKEMSGSTGGTDAGGGSIGIPPAAAAILGSYRQPFVKPH